MRRAKTIAVAILALTSVACQSMPTLCPKSVKLKGGEYGGGATMKFDIVQPGECAVYEAAEDAVELSRYRRQSSPRGKGKKVKDTFDRRKFRARGMVSARVQGVK